MLDQDPESKLNDNKSRLQILTSILFTGGHNEKVGLYCGKVENGEKRLTI